MRDLKIENSDKIHLQSDKWTKDLESAHVDIMQAVRAWQFLHDSKRIPEFLLSADGASSGISGGSSWEVMSVLDPDCPYEILPIDITKPTKVFDKKVNFDIRQGIKTLISGCKKHNIPIKWFSADSFMPQN